MIMMILMLMNNAINIMPMIIMIRFRVLFSRALPLLSQFFFALLADAKKFSTPLYKKLLHFVACFPFFPLFTLLAFSISFV